MVYFLFYFIKLKFYFEVMKKVYMIIVLVVVLVSCGTYRSVNVNQLTTGMTKNQVYEQIGLPERTLSVNQTDNGLQEVLQYRTNSNEIYALTFWNDYLTGYEFLYDDTPYVPAPAPPVYYPDYGRPIIIVPNRPVSKPRPNPKPQPSQKPSQDQNNRPAQNRSRQNSSTQTESNSNNNEQPTRGTTTRPR